MTSDGPDARTYQALAEGYDRQAQPQMRDRFLVLAAHAAFVSGQPAEADKLRSRLLQSNPHHLLKPYRSFAEAMKSVDVQNYIGALSRSHPPERVQTLLALMKINPAGADPGNLERILTSTPVSKEELKVYRLRTPAPFDEPPSALLGSRSSTEYSGSNPPSKSAPEIFGIRPDNSSKVPNQKPPVEFDDLLANQKRLGPAVLAGLILAGGCFLAAYTLLRPFLAH
jgi:hypothetical protein